ncbi:MAG: hypothetical protein M1819_006563 [Sarea resinae]|nr:MAG: hypothetical protein M1819_006563 [Sarea resinae]
MDEERKPSKRSRFDQTEPRERHGSYEDGRRFSRFDRRSRSPSTRDSRPRRSRSPVGRATESPATEEKKKLDPAAAAAAAAARINAQIQAKKGIQHVDVPPIRSGSTASPVGKSSSPPTSSNINGDMYVADGDYIRDIEVNDLRNRYTLTKGSTQKMTDAHKCKDVTTRGNYYPDKSMATPAKPPLYLHVTSTSKEGLEQAVEKIEELMKQELPNLVDERRFRRREPEQVERDEFGRRKWPEERIPIDLEPVPGFNLRAQVVGHGGAYVKHIQQETRCRVQIKGRGSGFMEHATQRESDEQMYLHVAGPDPNEVQRAKELCEDLLNNVREQYERFKSQPPPSHGYGGHGHGGYGQRDRQQSQGYGGGYGAGYGSHQHSNSPASAMSPIQGGFPAPGTSTPGASGAAPPGATAAPLADYGAAYAQYYGGQDPYAAYGGYQNYVNYYAYYQQQAAQQQQQAPPPPPGEAPPPPPPPPASASPAGYNSVPPPPGL